MGREVLYKGEYNRDILEWAKEQAEKEGKSFTEFVTEALEEKRERGQKD